MRMQARRPWDFALWYGCCVGGPAGWRPSRCERTEALKDYIARIRFWGVECQSQMTSV
jgi:hypothetical protein